MKTFVITENTITAHAGTPVDAVDSFSSEKELAALTAGWPMSRLVATWNGFAGVRPFGDLKPVKKFENRAVGVARIWAAVARLAPDVAKPAADVAPGAAGSKEDPRRKNERPRRARTGTGPKPGAVFERVYKGATYLLTAIERDGRVAFQLKGGKTFGSLTAAAKGVTGHPSISGVAFWGEARAAAAK